jgi:type IV fimbrial biogenesis protein FimT
MKFLQQKFLNHQTNGFSLIEVMTTCSIVGILLAISSPSYTRLLAENERDNFLSLLKTNLVFTRIFAIKNNSNVTLCPLTSGRCTKEWHKDIFIFADFNSNQELDGEDYILKVVDRVKETHTLTYPRIAVTYRADGSLDGFQSGSFIYCLPENLKLKGKRITVSQAGRIRIRDTDNC